MNTFLYEGANIKLLPHRLVRLRKQKGETQEKTATKLGLTRSAYSQYELGTRKPDPDTLVKIADYFSTSTDFLLGRDVEANEENEKQHITEKEKEVIDEFRRLEEEDQKYIIDLISRIKKK